MFDSWRRQRPTYIVHSQWLCLTTNFLFETGMFIQACWYLDLHTSFIAHRRRLLAKQLEEFVVLYRKV